MKPIIGITPHFNEEDRYEVSEAYASSLRNHGVMPIILPILIENIPQYLGMISGLLLSGGTDIHASRYGEQSHEKAEPPCHARDEFELKLCHAALGADMPILGICRGAQLINVALGGRLIQHCENHNFYGDDDIRRYIHSVIVEPKSKLGAILGGGEINVNSIHHQCICGKLGAGISASAWSPEDGLVEGIEVASKKFVIGVQWHAELLDDKHSEALFRAFANACLAR